MMNLIGDVKGKVAVMVDDMIDTAGEPSRCSLIREKRWNYYWGTSLSNAEHLIII